ncbi:MULTISPECIES: helix-turn-helix domain-containing protein [Klebsiella pneumoniae complex]|uniref:helix-turn-helix domain-containing protein n=1 Tax=Klebsiella pneumoniae complex TaxID=3390273 RepID=UPI000BA02ED2|nr:MULTISPECIES: helix-turn-helix domain-containing protein [Klebsiella]HBX9975507.1 helix-turn-helix domain-containing protein [Klebsiella variicola]HCQ7305623.1 helix-turn-helix domain-containing protein [Klebsiella quasipneumoniae subsp. similipneumoniae]EKZ5631166.1 helix-turn-helix domain-containing protein [Klebsiella pneumoniae]ELT5680928.1 helix-turn-helix domain-containing protein [Klebsiella pneumoniae]ELX9541921.1 helix-turn-helix domain-containing protein [Klebsiella pneumoniae]
MKNTEELNNQLIARLEEITQRGISKADMARIAGVTPQAVNGWFKKGVISKKSAIALAEAANVSVTWLLGEKVSEDSGLKPNESKMLRLFRQLPEAEQERMIDTFEVRLKEIDNYVEKYLRGRFKASDTN